MEKTYRIRYFAALREQRGLSAETVVSHAMTPGELYDELAAAHGFSLSSDLVKASVGDAFVPMDHPLRERDEVAFLPPVAGG